jgi:hypothetical protein
MFSLEIQNLLLKFFLKYVYCNYQKLEKRAGKQELKGGKRERKREREREISIASI